ncbi:hypothetical protein ARMGADRAFT_1067656 [Armillaria gallica]|uniref:Uncharacterized protein n=1 Tax=Armillaria gallica TaxID=47427 RepID=A0A2H3CQ32_ARMGA|nr:hypothetical protein ARMGADRAFT_1067656 [Armillaria gallica]
MFISVSGLEETGKFATGRTEEMKQGKKEATWICWEDKGNRVEVTTCFSTCEVSDSQWQIRSEIVRRDRVRRDARPVVRISGKGGRLRQIMERGYFIDERDSMFGRDRGQWARWKDKGTRREIWTGFRDQVNETPRKFQSVRLSQGQKENSRRSLKQKRTDGMRTNEIWMILCESRVVDTWPSKKAHYRRREVTL